VLDPQHERLVTVKEAAQLAGMTEGRIYQLLSAGEVNGIKLHGKAWLIPLSEAARLRDSESRVGRPRSRRSQLTK